MTKEKTRREHIRDNLCLLYDEYIDNKNAEINVKNEKIAIRNKEKLDYWKKLMQRESKPMLEPKIPKYTQAEFIRDFQRKYPIEMYRSKFNQYLNGTTCPSDDVIYCFAKFFDVAYDFIIGKSKIRNPETERVQTFIKLNDNAISTLCSIEKSSVESIVLNAILNDEATAKTFLRNIYEYTYHTYRRNKISRPSDEAQLEDTFYNMDKAMALTYYIETYFMPPMTPTFEARFENDLSYAYYCSHSYEQYELDKQRDIQAFYDSLNNQQD